MKQAFSLLELILVLLIIGILSVLILPRFHFSMQDTKIMQLKTDFTLLQNALALYKNTLLTQQNTKLNLLDEARINLENEALFYCSNSQITACKQGANCCNTSLLQSPIYSNSKAWIKTGIRTYSYFLNKNTHIEFTFDILEQELKCIKNCEYLK